MANLEASIAEAVKKGPPAPGLKSGDFILVDVDLLDENPFQPRVKLDAGKMEELSNSIAAQGLLQPIIVRPSREGRLITVAGHRRVEAFKRLRETAATPEEKQRFSRIPATVRAAIDDSQLAAMAYEENVKRSDLTPVEEGRALDRMIDAGLAATNEELASLTSQSLKRVQRLRRLTRVPKVIMTAMESGFAVVVGRDANGEPQEEKRKLDMMAGLQFASAHEHLEKTLKGPKLEERVLGIVRRSLAQNWSLRRVEDYVKDLIKGRDTSDADADAENRSEAPVFERSARRFSIDLTKLRTAGPEQLVALRSAFEALLKAPDEGA